MAEIIDMPKLSDTMSVGTLVKWNIQEGQVVAFGDILGEIETDKATMELTCTVPGTILRLYAPAGAQLPVGAPICAIGKKGEVAPDPAAAVAVAPPPPATALPPIPAQTEVSCIPAAPASAGAIAPQSDASRAKASPYAKRMAEKAALNLATLSGTGPGGRVLGRDVAAAALAPAAPVAPAGPVNVAVAPPADGKGIQPDATIPVGGMRQTIARRLLEAKTTVPHFYLEVEVDAAPLMAMRESLNQRLAAGGAEAIKLSVNDFILKASAEALRRVPAVNASWAGASIRAHGAVHLSFGVALEDGLVTPVIRDAHTKSLKEIAVEAKALIGKARARKLTPAEMSGSTFTVTNLGMYGVTGFYGIINVPNAAILSVGATIRKPVVDALDRMVVGHRMVIGLAGDHRVIDGANAAQFLQALRQLLEEPTSMLI